MHIQSGLEYRTFKYRIHSKTKHFEGLFSNGQPFENRPFEIRTMVSLGCCFEVRLKGNDNMNEGK